MSGGYLATVAEMRALEAAAIATSTPEPRLMENAGAAIAAQILGALGAAQGRRALVLVGPGNNGGDGLAIARHLARAGASVDVVLERPRDGDRNLELARTEWVRVHEFGAVRLERLARRADAIIEARARLRFNSLRDLVDRGTLPASVAEALQGLAIATP